MALVIPNFQTNTGLFNGQCVADQTDWAILAAAADGNGVVSGCAVSQDTGSDMKVAVAAGVIAIAGTIYQPGATGGSPLTIGAASTTDRRDLVVYTVGTGYQVIAGTPCGTANYPVKPAVPANSVALGEVYVASNTTAIVTGNITDKTATVSGIGATIYQDLGTTNSSTLTNTPATIFNPTVPVGKWQLTAPITFGGETASGIAQIASVIEGTAVFTVPATSGIPAAKVNTPTTVAGDNVSTVQLFADLTVTTAGTVLVQAAVAAGGSGVPVVVARDNATVSGTNFQLSSVTLTKIG